MGGAGWAGLVLTPRVVIITNHSNGRLTPNYRRVKARQQNTFRIIGGVHRGRRFEFPGNAEVRPSPDRVRETLFNWLQPVIAGARCLDLYAGSGALGLEALSRGAAHAEFVDRTSAATSAIREHFGVLREGAKAKVNTTDVLAFLRSPPARRFDRHRPERARLLRDPRRQLQP